MKRGDRHDWTLFSSLSGKASQQACYWPHPPGEGVGQCNREQGTILDHLTIISKCTPVAISVGPPWERSFCSQLCLCFILLQRNLVMQIALLTPGLTTGKEAGGASEHTRRVFYQNSCFTINPHIFVVYNKAFKNWAHVVRAYSWLNIQEWWFALVWSLPCFSCLQYVVMISDTSAAGFVQLAPQNGFFS